MTSRGLPAVVATALVFSLAGCSSPSTSEGSSDGSSIVSAGSTTTAAPILLGLSPNLALTPGQCYASLQPVSTTTTIENESSTTTADTVPPTLPAITTTIPQPVQVAVVDCAGTKDGVAFASYCLGPSAEFDADLDEAPCPGDTDLAYPGDRTIRRAASRICLLRFAETFGEEYASSSRVAQEFVPNEGLWGLGDRRVSCVATEPSEPEPDDAGDELSSTSEP